MDSDLLQTIGLIVAFVALLALYPLSIMILWNWLAPTIFGLGTISYWEALGLKVLCELFLRTKVNLKISTKEKEN